MKSEKYSQYLLLDWKWRVLLSRSDTTEWLSKQFGCGCASILYCFPILKFRGVQSYIVIHLLPVRLSWHVYPEACTFPRDLPDPGIEPDLLHCRWILDCLSYQGSLTECNHILLLKYICYLLGYPGMYILMCVCVWERVYIYTHTHTHTHTHIYIYISFWDRYIWIYIYLICYILVRSLVLAIQKRVES